jgi:hypothetical protein
MGLGLHAFVNSRIVVIEAVFSKFFVVSLF